MIKIKNLTVRYNENDEKPALKSVSFSAKSGEKIALIGANGAGKSSLLLSMAGILTPRQGEITVFGTVLNKKTIAKIRENVGMIFQNPDHQLFMPTVFEDIAFGPLNMKISEKETEEKMDNILERLGIKHLKNRFSHKLSGGEKRLVCLAGILITNPRVLLMDEPGSFLDPRARRRLIDILKDLFETMIIATHDLDMALELCERTILLKEGNVAFDGETKAALQNEALLKECGLEPLVV